MVDSPKCWFVTRLGLLVRSVELIGSLEEISSTKWGLMPDTLYVTVSE